MARFGQLRIVGKSSEDKQTKVRKREYHFRKVKCKFSDSGGDGNKPWRRF